jgi:alpha-ketoglutarate-dependent taurine dioxygenase
MDMAPEAAVSERLAVARAAFGPEVRVSEPYLGRPPLWIEPEAAGLASDNAAAAAWMAQNKDAVDAALLSFGAVVLRGFAVTGTDDFASLMSPFETYSQGYVAGATDRQAIKGQVMEATRTPPEVYILLHQEMSYLPNSPRALAFYCRQPSPEGGETPICDMRGLLEALPQDIARRLADDGVLYLRNLRSEAVQDWRADPVYRHASWQYWFGSEDRAAVEAKLAERGVSFRWEDDGALTFWTHLPGVVAHPATGEALFFNQLIAQAEHRVSAGDARADLLDRAYGKTTPRSYFTAFGDGAQPTEAEFQAIHGEFERRKVAFAWQAGDVMLVENRLTSHGRHPYRGPRDVQVMLLA